MAIGSDLRFLVSVFCCAALLRNGVAAPVPQESAEVPQQTAPQKLSPRDIDLIDDISRRSFRYFWEQSDPTTGLVLDRALAGTRQRRTRYKEGVASIAATGFGLSAYCIAADHRWISREVAEQRVLTALRFFANEAPDVHGWFYHFMDSATGERSFGSEVSSIDTALLLAGILTAREYFKDNPEIVWLATGIYNRVDFPWMMDGNHRYFSHGWTPEKGFLPYRWSVYSELLILYVLGIGSPTHPISSDTWNTWKLPLVDIGDYTYVGGGPLFIHQYSLAWVDLRNRYSAQPPANQAAGLLSFIGPRPNYLANSVAATRAQQELFSRNLSRQYPGYSDKIWGVTASDSAKGYTDWGGSATNPNIDGTVVPSAAAGSLMLTPDICIPALRTMLVKFGKKIYGRYGFADAFNPTTGWVSQYVIGIDVGITLLSAENLRTGNVWEWFMGNPEPERALDMVGLLDVRHPLQNYEIQTTLQPGSLGR